MQNTIWRSITTGAVGTLATLTCLSGQAVETRIHQVGRIRVVYQMDGPNAVKPDDVNQNGLPDQVEDLMTQVNAARLLFVEILGFPDPLETERFRSARFIDIRIRNKNILGCNGTAYDEVQSFGIPGDPKGTLSIGFCVSSSLEADNLTPAHEFFHLIQYSTSYFKNRWYTEGTARWSERALGDGSLGPVHPLVSWPLPEDKIAAVYAMSYDASEYFWNPLAAKLDPKGLIPDSAELKHLQAMTYTDGTPVLKDLDLTGWQFVRDVIVELGKIDDLAFRELGYDRWSEANQFSPRNNPFILQAVKVVVRRHEVASSNSNGNRSGEH